MAPLAAGKLPENGETAQQKYPSRAPDSLQYRPCRHLSGYPPIPIQIEKASWTESSHKITGQCRELTAVHAADDCGGCITQPVTLTKARDAPEKRREHRQICANQLCD